MDFLNGSSGSGLGLPVAEPANPLASYLSSAASAGAPYYSAPYSYDGVAGNARLGTSQMGQVANLVSSGVDYNMAVALASGDGIGTGVSGPTYNLATGTYSSGGYGGYAMPPSGDSGTSGLNPYLTKAQQAIASQVTDNLNRNIMPGLSSAAMASGNFGGSRQGVVEANALNDANRQIANGMANLSFNAYESDANRGLQQQSINNSYNLGLGNLALGNTQADNSFYTAQRGQDLQSTALGAQLMNQGNTGYLNQGQGVYNIGNSYSQAPWTTIGNYNGTMNPYTGFGSTSTSGTGGGASGVLGGALGGANLWSMFGGNSGGYKTGYGSSAGSNPYGIDYGDGSAFIPR